MLHCCALKGAVVLLDEYFCLSLYSQIHDLTAKAQAWHVLCQQQRRRIQLIAQLLRKS